MTVFVLGAAPIQTTPLVATGEAPNATPAPSLDRTISTSALVAQGQGPNATPPPSNDRSIITTTLVAEGRKS